MAPPEDTIVALATPVGAGAIGVVRVSGCDAIEICDKIFQTPKRKKLYDQKTHTVHFGKIFDGNRIIDEIVATLFVSPRSYTGEDIVELSCHGSSYILKAILELLKVHGCRMANPGEFTLRAFLNGKLDLVQAEAVADLIASESEMSHKIALKQMRKGYSYSLKQLRDELIDFVSLIELELDFSEEDVTFFDKTQLMTLLQHIEKHIEKLVMSFSVGNAMKKGIPVVISGNPNVGKSTLLNTILNEDRSIVSPIAGTTRDFVEDQFILGGNVFRFIDTAGIRNSDNSVETAGIQKTYEKMADAGLILYLFDANFPVPIRDIKAIKSKYSDVDILLVANKIDLCQKEITDKGKILGLDVIEISAKDKYHLDELLDCIQQMTLENQIENQVIVSNSRHHEALQKALEALRSAKKGLENAISGDLLAVDFREALHQIGLITGEVSSEDLLSNIFRNFCIGK